MGEMHRYFVQLTGLILEKDQRNGIETVKRFVCGEKKRDS